MTGEKVRCPNCDYLNDTRYDVHCWHCGTDIVEADKVARRIIEEAFS